MEEESLLGRARTAAYNRPIAQNIILNSGAYPPRGISRKAHVAFGLEACRCFHEPDMSFLDQVGGRQAVVAKSHCDRDDKPHMGMDELMQSRLILIFPPAAGQIAFLPMFEKRRGHRRRNELPVDTRKTRHLHEANRSA